MNRGTSIAPGPRRGAVTAPPSKSHAHRLLIANFLAGDRTGLAPAEGDGEDILATKRCLGALGGTPSARGEAATADEDRFPVLDCGESGSTLRFLAPVAAALGKHPRFLRRGRLAERPFREYPELRPGVHVLPGDVSSQFATGLLFALPLLGGDSEIRFSSPPESLGYIELTLRVLAGAAVTVEKSENGFRVPGGQRYRLQKTPVEGDWSGAAAWLAMNALGSEITVGGLAADSAQPDRIVSSLLPELPTEVDVSQCPDLFPVLSAVAAGRSAATVFTGIRRLRIKECDRVEAMREVLTRFGAGVRTDEGRFTVSGTEGPFHGGGFRVFDDHRIAMAVAVGAVRADSPVTIDNAGCTAKSYPGFLAALDSLICLPLTRR